jgi:hypothetical protein
MLLQFGTNTPIRSTKTNRIDIPLDQAQKQSTITFSGRHAHGPDDKFVLLMRDPDAPDGQYIHLLIVNSDGIDPNDGTVVLSYKAPQRVGHRYIYELYKHKGTVKVPRSTGRQSFDVDDFVHDNNLVKVASIIVHTTEANKSLAPKGSKNKLKGGINEDDIILKPVKYHNFSSGLSHADGKYCDCTLEVEAKIHETGYHGNPYAICSHSTHGHVKECGTHYEYEEMPLKYLLTFADRHKVHVPDRTSRKSAIKAIYDWKAQEA